MSRQQLTISLQANHAQRLNELAVMKGVSKSSIIASAFSSWLAWVEGEQHEEIITRRLDRLSRQFDRLERDQNILIETLALFVRYYLTASPPIPESHQAAARAQGKLRFSQFIEQLGRHVQRGGSLVRDIEEEAQPTTDADKTSDTSNAQEGQG